MLNYQRVHVLTIFDLTKRLAHGRGFWSLAATDLSQSQLVCDQSETWLCGLSVDLDTRTSQETQKLILLSLSRKGDQQIF